MSQFLVEPKRPSIGQTAAFSVLWFVVTVLGNAPIRTSSQPLSLILLPTVLEPSSDSIFYTKFVPSKLPGNSVE
jgi:hypothetical protein